MNTLSHKLSARQTLGPVLILGGDKETRLAKAWELLLELGFQAKKESPDLLMIQKEEGKKSVGISQAKEIKAFLREKPFERKVKAVLVEETQAFTDEAQNSLLKILEEPPCFALIILLADKEGSLLPTVVSRCRRVVVKPGWVHDGAEGCPEGTPTPESREYGEGWVKPESLKSPYNLWTKSPEELFDLAKDLSTQGKDAALEFLELVLREDVKLNSPELIIEKLRAVVKELKEANVDLRFALEYAFLIHTGKSL